MDIASTTPAVGTEATPAPKTAPKTATAPANGKEAKAAKAFEAVFLGQMMQMMMGTVDNDGPFSGGHGEEMFRGILAEKLGTAVSDKGGIGLAPKVMDEIIKLQGGARAD